MRGVRVPRLLIRGAKPPVATGAGTTHHKPSHIPSEWMVVRQQSTFSTDVPPSAVQSHSEHETDSCGTASPHNYLSQPLPGQATHGIARQDADRVAMAQPLSQLLPNAKNGTDSQTGTAERVTGASNHSTKPPLSKLLPPPPRPKNINFFSLKKEQRASLMDDVAKWFLANPAEVHTKLLVTFLSKLSPPMVEASLDELSKEDPNPQSWRSIEWKKETSDMPFAECPGDIEVISNPADAYDAVQELRKANVIGFDTETKPVFSKKQEAKKVALIQCSTQDFTALFRIHQMCGIPKSVRKLLEDREVIKVGVGIGDDMKALLAQYQLDSQGYLDLRHVVQYIGGPQRGLQFFAASLLNKRLSKGAQVSNWERDILSKAQIKYAATDAWIGLELFERMVEAGVGDKWKKHVVQRPINMSPLEYGKGDVWIVNGHNQPVHILAEKVPDIQYVTKQENGYVAYLQSPSTLDGTWYRTKYGYRSEIQALNNAAMTYLLKMGINPISGQAL